MSAICEGDLQSRERVRQLVSRDSPNRVDIGRRERAAECRSDWRAESKGKVFVPEADVNTSSRPTKQDDAEDRDDGNSRESYAPIHAALRARRLERAGPPGEIVEQRLPRLPIHVGVDAAHVLNEPGIRNVHREPDRHHVQFDRH